MYHIINSKEDFKIPYELSTRIFNVFILCKCVLSFIKSNIHYFRQAHIYALLFDKANVHEIQIIYHGLTLFPCDYWKLWLLKNLLRNGKEKWCFDEQMQKKIKVPTYLIVINYMLPLLCMANNFMIIWKLILATR